MLNPAPIKRLPEIEKHLKRGRKEYFHAKIDVNPDIAEFFLRRNPNNRNVRWRGKQSVVSYAKAMANGDWEVNGESIVVSKDGFLNDGQHRLHAVIESGVSVPMAFAFGVDRDTRHTLDQGSKRTNGHVLKMHNIDGGTSVAATLNYLMAAQGKLSFNDSLSSSECLRLVDEYPDIGEAIRLSGGVRRKFKLSLAAMAASTYLCMHVDRPQTEELLEGVVNGLNIDSKNDPIFKLRTRYFSHVMHKNRIGPPEQGALFIKAFNYLRQGRRTRSISWRDQGSSREAFPVPV